MSRSGRVLIIIIIIIISGSPLRVNIINGDGISHDKIFCEGVAK